MAQAIKGLLIPDALPSACFEDTKTYGTFLSSQSKGKCIMISTGSVSAAKTRISACPLFKAFVAV